MIEDIRQHIEQKFQNMKYEESIRKLYYEEYRKLRWDGHSIYCALNMVLTKGKCRCEEAV